MLTCSHARKNKIIVGLAIAVISCLLNRALAENSNPTAFAVGSTAIWDSPTANRSLTINSPDGKKKIITSVQPNRKNDLNGEYHLELQVLVGKRVFTVNVGPGIGSELMWAPDSQAFFLTTSDEGRNGRFHILGYLIGAHGLRKILVAPTIERVFGHPVKCGSPELPNVVGIGWNGGSKRLIVAAQVIRHTNCDSNGMFKVYDVLFPNVQVIHQYGQIEAKKRFGELLGPALKEARDECVTNPHSCEVPFNHSAEVRSR